MPGQRKNSKEPESLKCYHCGTKRKYAKDCPNKTNSMHITIAAGESKDTNNNEGEGQIFHQIRNIMSSRNWLLRGNQSTVDQIVNQRYLTIIYRIQQAITVYCDAGSLTTNQKGTFGKLSVWYNSNRITKMISLKKWLHIILHTPGDMVRYLH